MGEGHLEDSHQRVKSALPLSQLVICQRFYPDSFLSLRKSKLGRRFKDLLGERFEVSGGEVFKRQMCEVWNNMVVD